jgi:transposase-like protein
MSAQRKTYSAEFKSKVAIEAIRGFHTINELAAQYGVHPHQISMWKAQLLEAAPGVFSGRADQQEKEAEALQDKLYQQIGKLQTELDWLKKRWDLSVEHKRALVEPDHQSINKEAMPTAWTAPLQPVLRAGA